MRAGTCGGHAIRARFISTSQVNYEGHVKAKSDTPIKCRGHDIAALSIEEIMECPSAVEIWFWRRLGLNFYGLFQQS